MADKLVDANVYANLHEIAQRAGPFYVSTTVGYIIQVDHSLELQYVKTSDGGATWAAAVQIKTGDTYQFDCFPDWQVDGDAGTKIHIFYMYKDDEAVRYIYLDTDGDSVGGDDLIESCGGTGTFEGLGRPRMFITGCKTRGGLLRTAFWYNDSEVAYNEGVYSSPDGGTWTPEADVFEGAEDHGLLCPANLADPDDTWMFYHDNSAALISIKTYDDSGNSWSEDAIDSMAGAASFLQMDCQVRLSDGNLIGAYVNLYNQAGADIRCVDIANGSSITQKTNIVTDQAETVQVGLMINQVNDDIHVVYITGTDWTTLVKAVIDKSEDGGATWAGETAYQADAEDDMRWVGAGCMKAAWGGFFQPVFFNDDLNDLFVNVDNDVEIAAGGAATVEGSAAGSGIGLASSSAKLDVLASALGNGIGLSQAASHLIISATASGQGIGLATAQAILDVLAAAAASGEGLGACDWAWLRKKLRLVPYAYSPRREGGGST